MQPSLKRVRLDMEGTSIPAAASKEQATDEGFLEYEEGLRAAAAAETKQLPGDKVQPEADPGISLADAELLPDPPHSSLSPAGCKLPGDDPVYDTWLQTAERGPYKDVVDPAPIAGTPRKPIGEFRPLNNGKTYKAVMRCQLHGHVKCNRTRGWKMAVEEPSAVDRTLVAWVLEGRNVKPKPGQTLTEAHMQLPKL